MLMSKWSGPQAVSSEAPPTPPRLPTEVMSCPSTGLVPVLVAWSPGSQSVGAQSQRGWRVGHRPPAEPELRAAAGDPDCGPLVILRPQAVSPRAAAHLAGPSVSSPRRPEAPGPTSRDFTHVFLPSARGRYLGDRVGALFPGRVLEHRVRPLALWACRLVRGSRKTELDRLWWGSPERRLRSTPGGGAGGWRAGPLQGRGRSLVGGPCLGRGWVRVGARLSPGVEPESCGRGLSLVGGARAGAGVLSLSTLNPSPFCSSGPSRTGKADVAEPAPRSRGAAHLSREAARASGGANVLEAL